MRRSALTQANKFNVFFVSNQAPGSLNLGSENVESVVTNMSGLIQSAGILDICGREEKGEMGENWATKARKELMETHAVLIDYGFLLECGSKLSSGKELVANEACLFLACIFCFGLVKGREAPVIFISEKNPSVPDIFPPFLSWLSEKDLRSMPRAYIVTDPNVLAARLSEAKMYKSLLENRVAEKKTSEGAL